MTVRIFNGFTCCARIPSRWKTGLVCLLIDTDHGLALVDTGLGLQDYANPTWFTQFFRIVSYMPFDPQEAAVNQLPKFGYQPDDVKHIFLTHMHFDHIGGLADFPHAKVHVYKKEYDAFVHRKGNISAAYIPRHIAHKPDFVFYENTGEQWFEFDAIRVKEFEPEMYFVPLPYHSVGMCGIAIQDGDSWHFHCGDAAADFRRNDIPEWVIRLILGPHMPRLRVFSARHPEIHMTASHMFLDFFDSEIQFPSEEWHASVHQL
jgi:glyoxylase-like metal-dependent hydrolase (beta-lactamase superfamily II)